MDAAVSSGWVLQDHDCEIAPPRLSEIGPIADAAKSLGLSENGWRALITSQHVVCANSVCLAGLYVADHYSFVYEGDRLRELQAARSVLCNRFKLNPENVAFGAEAVINPAWQGSDLRSHLLRALLRNVALRYRHAFRFCRKDDPAELENLNNEGWRCFQEEDEACYLVLDVAKALRGLATKLMLRFPAEHVKLRIPMQAGRRIS